MLRLPSTCVFFNENEELREMRRLGGLHFFAVSGQDEKIEISRAEASNSCLQKWPTFTDDCAHDLPAQFLRCFVENEESCSIVSHGAELL